MVTRRVKAWLRQKRDAVLPGTTLDASILLPPSVEEVLPDGSSPWPISRELGRLLFNILSGSQRHNVLEIGAGSSSLVIARTLELQGGGRLTSIEQNPKWCAEPWAEVKRTRDVDAEMIVAQPRPMLTRFGPVYGFAAAARSIAARGPFDFVLVDAPQAYFGRDGALPLVRPHLSDGALIVLDDAGREMERWTLFRWLRSYPASLRLVSFDAAFGERGVAILQYDARRDRHLDLSSLYTGTIHTARLLLERRRTQTR